MKLSLVIFALACLSLVKAETVKTGFADWDISPDIGMERPGGYSKGYHTRFHDTCKARAVVFESGDKSTALVGLDALFIDERHVAAARNRISELTGIPAESILIGASHSHSSGPTGMVIPGDLDHASELVQDLAYEQSSAADPVYVARMIDGIVAAVSRAWETRSELGLAFGSGSEEKVSFNRRWRMKNGQTATHPRFGNPDMVETAGPIDPEVGVIGGYDDAGKLLGCVVNFACHATASPPGISANWPWAMEKVIRGSFGEDVVVVFLNGNSGDVTQVDNASPIRRSSGEADALRVGGSVGAEVVKVLYSIPGAARTKEATVDSRQTVLKIPRRRISAERLEESIELVKEKPTEAAAVQEWVWAKEIVILDALTTKEPVRSVEVQAIQIGPAVFISNPAEYFCEFGLQQKAGSKFPFTWPVSLANGCVGYVPTTEALGPKGGGYETRLTAYSNLVPEAGDQIRDEGIELANALSPDKVAKGLPAASFTAGWTYGDNKPELE
ncbi:MAG: hypothetical protein P1U86_02745 [Verrucomicrobiales bacterium]|nr:hypothetical protein [Verrucomicrobiales bacterium]